MQSCIFEGRVKHRRTQPALHRFSYRVFYLYLDLGELPTLFERRWLWSAQRPAIARFRREDHLGAPDEPLDDTVRNLVAAETGIRPTGPIRLLTQLSYFGYCFNPVSFYYCFDESGRDVETIVAEVTNTPWGERMCYVLPEQENVGDTRTRRFRPAKKMHVSPFMPMEVDYDWCFSEPGKTLRVYMANGSEGRRFFDASVNLTRSEITGTALARVLIQYPLMTLRIIAGIHWQALRLWVKKVPFYPHPSKNHDLIKQKQTTT